MYITLLSLTSSAWRCLLFMALGTAISVAQTLKEVAKFDLPGPEGKRFDYLTIDSLDQYLISAHLGAQGCSTVSSTIAKTLRPFQKLVRRHVVEDSRWIKLRSYRRGNTEFHELKL